MESLTRLTPTGRNFELHVPTRNREWYLNGYESFTSSIFVQFCKSSDLIIDLGAHVGFFSLLAAASNKNAEIIAIEASPDNFEVLAKNLNFSTTKFRLINKAFSNVNGFVNFEIASASDNSCVGGSEFSETIRQIKVETITGDDLQLDLNKNILIKIDIEGYELVALSSLERIIRGCKTIKLIIEFNPTQLSRNNCPPKQFIEKLHDLGFRTFAIQDEEFKWVEIKENFENYGNIINRMGYSNLVCVKSDVMKTISGVLHSSALGGGERDYLELATELIQKGFMFNSILPLPDLGLGSELLKIGSSVTYINQLNWWAKNGTAVGNSSELELWRWSEYVSLEVTKSLADSNSDIVLSSSVVLPQGAVGAALLNLPHIWWIQEFADIDHGLKLPLAPKELGNLIKNLSDGILCVSESVRDHFFDNCKGEIKVVFPQPKFEDAPSGNITQFNVFTIGVVASFQPGKGQSDVLEAVARLKADYLDVELIFFGSGTERDIQRLADLIQKLGIRNQVRFAGFVKERSEIYRQVDCIVVSSRNEAFGRVAFEATHFGVPVIYSDSAGPHEYMVPNLTGIPFLSGEIESLCEAIKITIANSGLRTQLVLEARRHFSELYKSKPLGEEISKLFIELHSQSKDPQILSEIYSAYALAERDSALAEREKILNSKIWRFTKPYRWIKSRF